MKHKKRVFVGKLSNFHYQVILCPNCNSRQVAKVIQTGKGELHQHNCQDCNHTILPNGWNEVSYNSDIIADSIKKLGITNHLENALEKCLALATEIQKNLSGKSFDYQQTTQSISDLKTAVDHLQIIYGENSVKRQCKINLIKLKSSLKTLEDYENSKN